MPSAPSRGFNEVQQHSTRLPHLIELEAAENGWFSRDSLMRLGRQTDPPFGDPGAHFEPHTLRTRKFWVLNPKVNSNSHSTPITPFPTIT